jgi:hypothetical protein
VPNEPLNFRLTATNEASPVVDDVIADIERVPGEVNITLGVTGGGGTAGVAEEATVAAESLTAVEEAVTNMATAVSEALVALNGVAEGLVSVEQASTAADEAMSAVEEVTALLGPDAAGAAIAAQQLTAALKEMQVAAAGAAAEEAVLDEAATGAGEGINFTSRASTTGIRDLYRVGVIANAAGVSFAGLSTRVVTSAVALAAFSNIGFLNAAAITGGLFLLGNVLDAFKGDSAEIAKQSTKLADDIAASFQKVKSIGDVTGTAQAKTFVAELGAAFVASNAKAGDFLLTLEDVFGKFDDFGARLTQLETKTQRADFFSGILSGSIQTTQTVVGGNAEIARSVGDAIQAYDDFDTVRSEAARRNQTDTVAFLDANKALIESLFEMKAAAETLNIDKVVADTKKDILAAKDGMLLWVQATNDLKNGIDGMPPLVDPNDRQIISRVIELFGQAAEGAKLWGDANRQIDQSLHPEKWDLIAQAAHDLANGQALTADETKAVQEVMDDYGVDAKLVLDAGKKLWDDQGKAAGDAAKKTAQAAKESGDAFGKLGDDLTNLIDKYGTTAAAAKVLQDDLDAQEKAGFAVHTAFGDAEDAVASFGSDIKDIVPDMKDQANAWNAVAGHEKTAGTHLTTYTEAGRKAIHTTEDLSKVVDTELTQAFINAKGSQQGFIDAGHDLAAKVTAALKAAGVAAGEIPNFLDFLGLTDEKLTIRLQVAEAADAMSLLQGIISDLNADLQHDPAFMLQLRTAIRSKDPVTGLAELIQHYQNNPAVLPALLDVLSGLPTDLQAQINQWLADHGITVRIGSTVTPPPPIDPNDMPKPDEVMIGSTVTPPEAPDSSTYPDAPPLIVPMQVTPPTMADITASADPFTASWLSGGITAPVVPPLPVAVVPAVDQIALDAAQGELDAATKDSATGDDREANIKATTSGTTEAKAAIDGVATNDGHGYIATIHVITDAPVPGGPGDTGTGGPTRSAPTVNVTQHITAGFGTDRFALQRAVHKANRDLDRLAGLRR